MCGCERHQSLSGSCTCSCASHAFLRGTSEREWKPGDVALVKFAWQVNSEPLVCMRAEQLGTLGWLHPGRLSGFTSDHHPAGATSTRLLAVLDPEDREQVERLSDLRAEIDRRDVHTQHWQDMQDALREFATPTEPKPEEPTGLGAVVEDADGRRWVRRAPAESWRESTWCPGDTHGFYDYADIAAVRVLSDGVQP